MYAFLARNVLRSKTWSEHDKYKDWYMRDAKNLKSIGKATKNIGKAGRGSDQRRPAAEGAGPPGSEETLTKTIGKVKKSIGKAGRPPTSGGPRY